MLIDFFFQLKQGGLPVTIKEFLTLLEALKKRVIAGSMLILLFAIVAILLVDKDSILFFKVAAPAAGGALFSGAVHRGAAPGGRCSQGSCGKSVPATAGAAGDL